MARLVVGGVECMIDETELTLGHTVIALRGLVAYGIAFEPQELAFEYERRGPDAGYRDQRASGKRAVIKLGNWGDVETLVALLRQCAPAAWRGQHDTVAQVLGEGARDAEEARLDLPRRRAAGVRASSRRDRGYDDAAVPRNEGPVRRKPRSRHHAARVIANQNADQNA